MSAPFGPKAAVAAEAGDLFLVTRGTGAGLEVEKLDPGTAAFAALLAPGITAYTGSSAWMTSGGSDGLSLRHGDGPPDDEEDGENGEFYIDVAAWDIYGPKDAGAWGAGTRLIGPPGDPGDDGTAGSQILKGTGAPASDLGSDSDWYFDTTAKAFYGPKIAGAWGSPTGVAGDAGEPGDDGDDGSDGRNPEFRKTATHLEWRLAGDVDWTVLVALADIAGPAGDDGDPGEPGAPGDDGDPGTPGSQFHAGAGAPSSGLGANGDWYFDTAAKAVHGKTGGTWGSGVSVKGDPGDDGANGATIHYGSGAPSSGLGADGDGYIDEATMAFYGPKAAGSWPAAKPLRPPVSVVSSLPGSPDAGTFYVITG